MATETQGRTTKVSTQRANESESQSGKTSQARSGTLMHRPMMPAPHLPFREFGRLRREFDRLVERLFGDWPMPAEAEWGVDSSRWGFSVEQNENGVSITAEAPGFEPDDFDVRIQGNTLQLCACRQAETAGEGEERWSRREFYRSVTLPEGVEADKVEATYRNGILTVTVPIGEQHRPRRIPVKT